MIEHNERNTRLKVLVQMEADNIKRFARASEINNLDLKEFHPTLMQRCIYGQLTGDCYSVRAVELLTQCSNPYSNDPFIFDPPGSCMYFEGGLRPLSPIECYITKDGAEHEKLIDYIKGKRFSLKLEDL